MVEKIANTLTPTKGKTSFMNDFKLPSRYERNLHWYGPLCSAE